MAENSSTASEAATERAATLREAFYRYLFYGWLFKDAGAGSALERATALRHNQEQAKWLPLYLLRWLVIGAILWTAEQASESMTAPALSIVLALGLVFAVLHLLLTTVFWAVLRGSLLRVGGR